MSNDPYLNSDCIQTPKSTWLRLISSLTVLLFADKSSSKSREQLEFTPRSAWSMPTRLVINLCMSSHQCWRVQVSTHHACACTLLHWCNASLTQPHTTAHDTWQPGLACSHHISICVDALAGSHLVHRETIQCSSWIKHPDAHTIPGLGHTWWDPLRQMHKQQVELLPRRQVNAIQINDKRWHVWYRLCFQMKGWSLYVFTHDFRKSCSCEKQNLEDYHERLDLLPLSGSESKSNCCFKLNIYTLLLHQAKAWAGSAYHPIYK